MTRYLVIKEVECPICRGRAKLNQTGCTGCSGNGVIKNEVPIVEALIETRHVMQYNLSGGKDEE